jgi:DNA-binding IscR family transcriptional regulator
MANNRASLMNVGREVDYAVRALSYMAVASRWGAPIRRADIGQAQAIPRHYLAKILRKAVDGGLVESGAGRSSVILKRSARRPASGAAPRWPS